MSETPAPEVPGPPAPAGEATPPRAQFCSACRRLLKPGAAFCTHCGHRAGAPAAPRAPRERFTAVRSRVEREWGRVRFALLFYLALLGVQIVTAIAFAALGHDATALAVGAFVLAIVTLLGAARRWDVVGGFLARFGAPAWSGIAVAAAVPLFAAVHAFVYGLQWVFRSPAPPLLEKFAGLPAWWPILLICLAPACLEEIAFRGTIFGVLARHIRVRDALIVSSVAFAILHLSPFSLLSHTVLGLWFGWLRNRSDSLWPSMLAHFLHNGLVLANAHLGVLPVWTPPG